MAFKRDYRFRVADREYDLHFEYQSMQLRCQIWINGALVHNAMWANSRNAVALNVDGTEILVVCTSPLPNLDVDIALGDVSLITGRQISQIIDGTITGKVNSSLKGGFMTSALSTAPATGALPLKQSSPSYQSPDLQPSQTSSSQKPSLTDELEKLASLREKGLIDDDEYKTLKKNLIERTS